MVFSYERIAPVNGTRVLIKGYTGDTFLDRFNLITNKKILFSAETDVCEGKKYSSYIIDEEIKCIYVRNIFVQEIASRKLPLFSYDLFNVQLSTDRNIPSNWDVKSQIGIIWSHVSDPKLIEQFFTAVDSEGYESEAQLSEDVMAATHNESAWREGFKAHYGNSFLRTQENLSRLAEYHTHFRKKGVTLPHGIRDALSNIGIQTDASVLAELKSVAPRSPISLSPVQLDNMQYLRTIHEKLIEIYFPEVTAKVFLATKDSMLENDAKVYGGNIFINELRSNTLTELIDDFGHELTHILNPELDDNTSMFYGKIGFVMATITKCIVQDMKKIPVGPNVVW